MEKNLKDVVTPDLGSDHPVPIAEVFVEVGQTVAAEEPLLSLESEKAVMDLPAPFGGIIREILVEADDEIETGTVIMRFEATEENDPTEEKSGESSESPPAVAELSEPAPTEKAPEAVEPSSQGERVVSDPVHTRVSRKPGTSHASPSVRLYARELGVDLTRVEGTGPKNRVRREDVQNFVKALAAGTAGTGPSPGELPAFPYDDPSQYGSVSEEKLTAIQKITGTHLHSSWVNIPHVTHFDKADVTELEAWRKELNTKEKGERKYTSLAFVVKALAAAVKEYPRFNSVLAPGGDKLFQRDYINIAIAVDTPRGLLVPVIRDADQKGIAYLADEIISLAGKGREGRLKPEELKGAGITITNLGGIGGTGFTPVINPPEAAILGLSRSVTEPVWNGTEFIPRLLLPLSLSYDHRVIDGALAARFTARLAALLADMRSILL